MQKADLEQAIKTLRTGIASLNSEGRERLPQPLSRLTQISLCF